MRKSKAPYTALSAAYDGLMTGARYAQRAAFLDRVLRKSRIPVETVLDLACGTGTVSWALARRGWRVIGVDASEEMLAEASGKGGRFRGEPPQFLCQSMTRLDLGCTVDAAVSTIDAVNYLTTERELRTAFRRVSRHLEPGGLFVFDVNTPRKLEGLDGVTSLAETGGTYCAWQTFYDRKRRLCTWQVDLFREREDGAWERRYEEHRERAWQGDELIEALEGAGFGRVRIAGDMSLRPPAEDEGRWTVIAEKNGVAEKDGKPGKKGKTGKKQPDEA